MIERLRQLFEGLRGLLTKSAYLAPGSALRSSQVASRSRFRLCRGADSCLGNRPSTSLCSARRGVALIAGRRA